MGTNYGFKCDRCPYVTQNEDDHIITDDGDYLCLECARSMLKSFKCPQCKQNTQIEEIMINCVVSTDLRYIDFWNDEPRVHYKEGKGDFTIADGEVSRYQCGECGYVMAKTEEELIAWVKKNSL